MSETTKTVKTGKLQVGHIVSAHGMRVRIEHITSYDSDGSNRGEYPTVWSCVGTVLNADEVIARDPAMRGYLSYGATEAVRPEVREAHRTTHETGACWTIQGNDLARWYVEV